jgi:hypothetical protein
MGQREFTDSRGRHWLVWSTTPMTGSVLASEMRQGWLTFDSDSERRRLVPIPRDWENAANDRLELYCRAAQRVPRTTPIRGINEVPEKEG